MMGGDMPSSLRSKVQLRPPVHVGVNLWREEAITIRNHSFGSDRRPEANPR
jgi:hypothetical protein